MMKNLRFSFPFLLCSFDGMRSIYIDFGHQESNRAIQYNEKIYHKKSLNKPLSHKIFWGPFRLKKRVKLRDWDPNRAHMCWTHNHIEHTSPGRQINQATSLLLHISLGLIIPRIPNLTAKGSTKNMGYVRWFDINCLFLGAHPLQMNARVR